MYQNKPTPNDFPIIDLLKDRWSPRAFKNDPLTDEQLNAIFEAARWAPSAANEQPWRYFYAIQGSDSFAQFVNCLMPGNQPWAKNAGAIVFCFAKSTLNNGNPNPWALHDLGLSNSALIHQAFSMGIYSHVMGGIQKESIVQLMGAEEHLVPVVAIALGYISEPETLPEPYNEREVLPRVRKSQSDFVKKM